MFVNNRYLKIYENFINKKKNKGKTKSDFYESHHIIPRSLGGTNDASNLVDLTPREHFFAHLILSKITKDEHQIKMAHALRMMSGLNKSRKIINSRQYELSKSIIYNVLRAAGKDYQEEKLIQNSILTEYTDIDKVLERGVCKCCGIRPRAVNYIKNNRTFYRSKCDVCLEGKNEFRVPAWKIEGYTKNKSCEICNFAAKFTEQLTVITEKRKYKTICLNCQAEIKVNERMSILKPSVDF